MIVKFLSNNAIPNSY